MSSTFPPSVSAREEVLEVVLDHTVRATGELRRGDTFTANN